MVPTSFNIITLVTDGSCFLKVVEKLSEKNITKKNLLIVKIKRKTNFEVNGKKLMNLMKYKIENEATQVSHKKRN